MIRALAIALLALSGVAFAGDFEDESSLVQWLRSVRSTTPDAATRARVEALTQYQSKALRPSPEPHRGDEMVHAFNVASEARGTLRAWARNARLGAPLAPPPKASTTATIVHYVESANGGNCTSEEICTEIGVPVPIPQDSTTPFAGFRTYASLIADLQALVAQNSDVASSTSVGATRAGRDILAFTIGRADSRRPAFLQSGGIHAREWIAPEVVAGYLERVLGSRHDGGLYQYLTENVHSVLIPVLNVDGFLQTQRYPDRAVASTCSEDASEEPRDGRMRRKNMNADGVAVDEALDTASDSTLGVDANRNNLPWWGGGSSSGNPCSLLYRGLAAQSENEVGALQSGAALGPANRLRLFIDTHSYTRAYLSADTNNARRNALQQQLAQRMSAVAGRRYPYSASPAGGGIGSTDEYFANTYQIPAYTLEIEPSLAGGLDDYGGIDVRDSGFILPAAEVPRVRTELVNATVLGVYRQAGPPSISAVDLRSANGGAIAFAGHWSSASPRSFIVDQRQTLQAGESYVLSIDFTKPMRVRDGSGTVTQYAGQNVALAPTLALEGIDAQDQPFTVPIATASGQWITAHYADDAYAVTFEIPPATPIAGAKRVSLAVTASDFSGAALDANPVTPVDWSGGAWSGYEDSNCTAGDAGGTDRSLRVVDDGSVPCGAGSGGGSSGGGALDPRLLALFLITALKRFRKP